MSRSTSLRLWVFLVCLFDTLGCAADPESTQDAGRRADSGLMQSDDDDASVIDASFTDPTDATIATPDAGDAGRDAQASEPGICTRCGGCEETLDVPPASHVVGKIDYADKPPAGGPHNECWGTWGVHDQPLATERWVHNLEHGGVVFLYRCESNCPDIAPIETFVEGRTQALLTSYSDMDSPYAVVAWGHRLLSNCLDMQAFAAFYAAHVDHGPESISSGPPEGCPP